MAGVPSENGVTAGDLMNSGEEEELGNLNLVDLVPLDDAKVKEKEIDLTGVPSENGVTAGDLVNSGEEEQSEGVVLPDMVNLDDEKVEEVKMADIPIPSENGVTTGDLVNSGEEEQSEEVVLLDMVKLDDEKVEQVKMADIPIPSENGVTADDLVNSGEEEQSEGVILPDMVELDDRKVEEVKMAEALPENVVTTGDLLHSGEEEKSEGVVLHDLVKLDDEKVEEVKMADIPIPSENGVTTGDLMNSGGVEELGVENIDDLVELDDAKIKEGDLEDGTSPSSSIEAFEMLSFGGEAMPIPEITTKQIVPFSKTEKFLHAFKPTDLKEDPLPIKVHRCKISEYEAVGQGVRWASEYLYSLCCPLSLTQWTLRVVSDHLKERYVSDESELGRKELARTQAEELEPLPLMHTVVTVVDNHFRKLQARRGYNGESESQDVTDDWSTAFDEEKLSALSRGISNVSYHVMKNGRRTMEDKVVVFPALPYIFDLKEDMSYFAVFDGHQGIEAASYGAAQLHQILIRHIKKGTAIPDALRASFMDLDSAFLEKCSNEKIRSGTTAVVALFQKEKLYVAWAGDSEASLHFGDGQAKQLVLPHKPTRKDEQERIRGLGGEVCELNGVFRVNGTLAVTRSIGDPEFKDYVVANPEILEINRSDLNEEFMVLASDGLWDAMNAVEVGNFLNGLVMDNKVEDAAELLAGEAKARGSSDNISIVVILLKSLDDLYLAVSERMSSPIESKAPLGDHHDTYCKKPVLYTNGLATEEIVAVKTTTKPVTPVRGKSPKQKLPPAVKTTSTATKPISTAVKATSTTAAGKPMSTTAAAKPTSAAAKPTLSTASKPKLHVAPELKVLKAPSKPREEFKKPTPYQLAQVLPNVRPPSPPKPPPKSIGKFTLSVKPAPKPVPMQTKLVIRNIAGNSSAQSNAVASTRPVATRKPLVNTAKLPITRPMSSKTALPTAPTSTTRPLTSAAALPQSRVAAATTLKTTSTRPPPRTGSSTAAPQQPQQPGAATIKSTAPKPATMTAKTTTSPRTKPANSIAAKGVAPPPTKTATTKKPLTTNTRPDNVPGMLPKVRSTTNAAAPKATFPTRPGQKSKPTDPTAPAPTTNATAPKINASTRSGQLMHKPKPTDPKASSVTKATAAKATAPTRPVEMKPTPEATDPAAPSTINANAPEATAPTHPDLMEKEETTDPAEPPTATTVSETSLPAGVEVSSSDSMPTDQE